MTRPADIQLMALVAASRLRAQRAEAEARAAHRSLQRANDRHSESILAAQEARLYWGRTFETGVFDPLLAGGWSAAVTQTRDRQRACEAECVEQRASYDRLVAAWAATRQLACDMERKAAQQRRHAAGQREADDISDFLDRQFQRERVA